ncbi:MSHA biogenesis protein MshL [Georgfuchsia toluolica]|uniref:MSHA biogenesis protein MshL n=1 Tax=Georgfuchsia toluolica TaxID=424218 RepID=A0A916J723_9PROT|nr:pilus (MSHA type) biogenesis protein MshL [Georgfuchsia toluolica]CAG4885200.1 MSHA biogenesis protein MshL [Georgfuchsia toluolica]
MDQRHGYLWIASLLLSLAACTPPAVKTDVHDRIADEMRRAGKERKSTATAESAEQSLMPPLAVEMPRSGAEAEARFDLSLVNAPATQVFMALVTGTRYNMLITPEVSGQITVNLKDVTVKEALDAIRELYGYEYRMQGNRITILPNTIQTRIFQVNYLDSRRQGASDLHVTSSSISTGGTGTGSTTTTGASTVIPSGTGNNQYNQATLTSQVRTSTDNDFWKDLTTALNAIVGSADGRSIVINPNSGMIVLRAMPREIRAVENYLKATQIVVERQVMIEAKILDVQLNDDYQSGVNWAAFRSNKIVGIGSPGVRLGTSGALIGPDVTATIGSGGSLSTTATGSQGFFGLAFQTGNFSALLNFLETQGSVSVLSSPRIATLNNQKAVLKVGTDELFVTNVTSTTTTTTTGTTNAPSLTLTPYFSGISLDVTPQIDENDNIILHVHPAVSTVADNTKVVDLGSLGSFKLPLAKSSVNETDSIVRVQDGQIVAIGGLMTQDQTNDRSQIPGLGSAPVIGAAFGQRSNALHKRELIILLKPTLVRDDRVWARDIEQSAERMRSLSPSQLHMDE